MKILFAVIRVEYRVDIVEEIYRDDIVDAAVFGSFGF